MMEVLEYGWSTGVSTGVLESHLKCQNIIQSVGLPEQYFDTPKQYSRTPIHFSTPRDLPIFQSKFHTRLML